MESLAMRLALPLAALAAGCAAAAPDTESPVVATYAKNLDATYLDVLAKVQALQQAVDDFVAAPSASGQLAAQQAWLAAHQTYGECEYSRFYAGPIDQAQGGMNEWPIDENFIDYTAGNPSGGIINDPAGYPQLSAQVLAAADERGGIENLSIGFHAIEFLLWGQRASQTDGPGMRPFTDYVDGGTALNQDRRRTYLKTIAQMLVDAMRSLEAEWHADDPSSYAAKLLAGSGHDGVQLIMRGFSQMAISELYYERMDDAIVTQDRKDEESCFSETTLVDLQANALGVEDCYLGRYGTLQGPSLSGLVAARDPALDGQLRAQLEAVRQAIDAIPPPFDHAVIAAVGTPEHAALDAAIQAFQPLRALILQVAMTLGVSVNI